MEHALALTDSSFRGQDHLAGGDAQRSAPGTGEILVRVQACGVSRVERTLSTGVVSQLSRRGAPYIGGMDAAGTVIATGDRVTGFVVGDEVFGHLPAGSWSWVQPPCARTTAAEAHIELRPEGIDPLAAAALAGAGLRATTLLRAAEPRPGETALVIGATSNVGRVLVPLLSDAGVRVIAGATPEDDAYVRSLGAAETFEYASAGPVAEAVASHPDVDLFVDLVSFDEPYFITAAAHGTIVTALPAADGLGLPRIGISAEPGDLAALAQRALEGRPVEIAPRLPARKVGLARRATATPPAQPAFALR
jgi:NADPH:quinone reductase-like Zn-dependent oxidoreductase